MEVYVLDNSLRREEVIDLFESCIWTERHGAEGDFELVMYNNPAHKRMMRPGRRLAMTDSFRVMEVITAETTIDADGKDMLVVKGKSLESMLRDRVATKFNSADINEKKEWVITGKPADVARTIFNAIVRNGAVSQYDRIPFLLEGTAYPASSIQEPQQVETFMLKPQSLYDTLVEICSVYDLGFRLYRVNDESKLFFDIYTGHNRTGFQTTRDAVIFSPKLDNLQNIKELNSQDGYKNVAYVHSKFGAAIVYAPGIPQGIAGFQRRVLYVDATSNESQNAAQVAELKKIGEDALAEHQLLSAFDGEVSQYGNYRYGRDYHLGDLIEMRSDDGAVNVMRVTEQIFVSDAEGERSYPTFSLKTYIPPGTWGTWDFDQEWSSLTDETWDTI